MPPGLIGRTFGSVAALRFATYLENVSSTGNTAPIGVHLASPSTPLGYATAVFEPRVQATKPATKRWQTWNALAGTWWTSKVTSGACSQAQPCPWTEMTGKLGAATKITEAYFELGDSGTGFSGERCALDDVTVNGVSYDFEKSGPAQHGATATVPASVTGPGGRVTVHGAGFQAGEKVAATLHSAPVPVGSTTADGAGAVTLTFTVPAGTGSGSHVVLLTGLTSGRTATAALTVTGGPHTGLGGRASQVARHRPAS